MRLRDRLYVIWRAPERFKIMEEMNVATAAEYAQRLDAVSNDLARDLADLTNGNNAAYPPPAAAGTAPSALLGAAFFASG